MFERYTERARRAIFFARYEASHYGSPYIETEHLLLGLMRETKQLTARFLQQGGPEAIRQQIETRSGKRSTIPTNVDLPLSNESKRVLAYSAEEADRLNHRHIGSEHLLLGLLREKDCFAAEILRQSGLKLEELREELGKPVQPTRPLARRGDRRFSLPDTVEIHGSPWDAEYIHNAIEKWREYEWHWQKQEWKPRDIAIHRGDKSLFFDLSLAHNPADFELVKAGWKKDHCVICRWELFESKDDPNHGTGHTNGRDWLCTECYEKFLSRPDFFSSLHPEIT